MKLNCHFTRKKLIEWLVGEEDNPFGLDDYNGISVSDDRIIHEAGEYGYIKGVQEGKVYCFTDKGNIVEQRILTEYK